MNQQTAAPETAPAKSMDEIVALCRRRGFIWQASEIYGGINGFWDYGPLGALLKNNIRDSWWRAMVECPPLHPETGEPLQLVGLDSAIIQHPKVWEASGHVGGFNDPMVDDKETKQRFRADHLIGQYMLTDDPSKFGQDHPHMDAVGSEPLLLAATLVANSIDEAASLLKANPKGLKLDERFGIKIEAVEVGDTIPEPAGRITYLRITPRNGQSFLGALQEIPAGMLSTNASNVPSPFTGRRGTLTEPRQFNLMFPTYVGAVFDEENKAYLRPETAQGIFLNYKNVLDTMRVRVPFGIAQVGKAFRNEVTPRNFIFRSREFEQMEMEWFCHPDEAKMWKDFWQQQRMDWYRSLGLSEANLTFREHEADELSHYAKEGYGTVDVEYRWPFTTPGFGELEGVAHRTDYDLRQHAEHAGAKLEYFDQERKERYYPHVIEPAAGLTRATLAVICEAFTPTPDRKGTKYMLQFAPHLAPVKAGIFPLVNKDGMPEIAKKLYLDLRRKYVLEYDVKQSIGKRYARMDEAGTPYCFTIDGQTLEDQTVTVRHRDTQEQERIPLDKVEPFLAEHIGA